MYLLSLVLALCSTTEAIPGALPGPPLETPTIPGIRGANVSHWGSGVSGARALGHCEPGKVDCGGCQCVEPSTCRWCHGMGGTSPGTAATGVSSCGPGLVNCGICQCTTRSSCLTCDGQGGPAAVISSGFGALIHAVFIFLPLFQLL